MPRINLYQIRIRQERAMLQSFNAIVSEIKDQAVLAEIVRALEVGNVDAVITLLGMDAATWEPMEQALREAYRTGGITGAKQIGRIPVAAGSIAFRFNVRAPAAERWIAERSSALITEIITDQREVIRAALADGLARGNGPRQTALDLIGRVNPATRQRTGGVIGLTSNQQGWISNARRELEELNPNYLSRALRDKRLDGAVRRAIESGTPLPARQMEAAITNMQARALRYRGEVIARTESINALRAGQWQAVEQAVGEGEIDQRDAIKRWSDSGADGRTRPTHAAADGQEVPTNRPFTVGGYQLMFSGDSSLGAPAEEIIQCRCSTEYEIRFLNKALRIEGFS